MVYARCKRALAFLLEYILDFAMEQAVRYPRAIDECRLADVEYYRNLTGEYGLI